jgi:hypothetical protein
VTDMGDDDMDDMIVTFGDEMDDEDSKKKDK